MLQTNIRILTWFNFFTDFRLYAPVAIIYFVHVTGSYALGMSIFSITMVSSALFEIPTGIFSDYIGRRKTMIYGALAAVLFSVLYAIGQSFWILALGAVCEGFSRALYSGNNDALLHDTLTQAGKEGEYDEYLGKVSSMFQVALAISALLGGFLAEWSFALIMWISVVPQVICLVLATRFIEPSVHSGMSGNIYEHLKAAAQKFAVNYRLQLLSISSVVTFALGEVSYLFQAAFYQTVWPLWAIGVAKMLSNIGAAFGFRFSGRIIRKFGAVQSLILYNAYARIINIVALLFPTIISPVLMSSTSLLYGVSAVSKNSLMQKEFTSADRATMGSLNSFAGSILFGVVSFVLGYAADIVSPARALIALQLLFLPVFFIYWKLYRHSV